MTKIIPVKINGSVAAAAIGSEGRVTCFYQLIKGQDAYSCFVSSVCDGEADFILLEDISKTEAEAREIFASLALGNVTPVCARDVLDDIISERRL